MSVEEGEEFLIKEQKTFFNRRKFPRSRVEKKQPMYFFFIPGTQNIRSGKNLPVPCYSWNTIYNQVYWEQQERNRVTQEGKPIRITTYFSTETLKARRAWNNAFQALKNKTCQIRLPYPAKLSQFKEEEKLPTI